MLIYVNVRNTKKLLIFPRSQFPSEFPLSDNFVVSQPWAHSWQPMQLQDLVTRDLNDMHHPKHMEGETTRRNCKHCHLDTPYIQAA
jgi:hypothetical protein